jgi:hypothetical protein
MASNQENLEKGLAHVGAESGSDDKVQSQHIDGKDAYGIPAVATTPARIFEAPERIRNMTPEERHAVESRLKRKIDARLMPMIVLMCVLFHSEPHYSRMVQEQCRKDRTFLLVLIVSAGIS